MLRVKVVSIMVLNQSTVLKNLTFINICPGTQGREREANIFSSITKD